jgi:copper(I)-binding protein
MFVDLAVPLTAGQTFELSLNFQNAGTLTVPVTVGEVGSEKPAEPQSHHH